MKYLRCATLVLILQLVWAANTEAAIVRGGFSSASFARWCLSATGPWTSVALPCADTLVRAFVHDGTAVEGEHWYRGNIGIAQSVYSMLSPAWATIQNECHTVHVVDGVAYGFEEFGEDVEIRLDFASAELVETMRAESTGHCVWLDDGVGLEHHALATTGTPFPISGWKNSDVVDATRVRINDPLFASHDHVISGPNALTLRLLAWLVVLMTVSARTNGGWTNDATWYVFVWTNACASEYWQGRVAVICESEDADSPLARNERIRSRLVRELAAWVQEKNPLREQASLYGDLLRGVIDDVDWMRIVDSWLTERDTSHRQRPLTETALRV